MIPEAAVDNVRMETEKNSGVVLAVTGTVSQVRVLNRPNKPWLRIEDANDPDRLSILINKEDLIAALRSEGIID